MRQKYYTDGVAGKRQKQMKGGFKMYQRNKLKGKIVEKGKTTNEIAEALGVDRSTYYRKISSEECVFTGKEIQSIIDCLQLTREEMLEIFFA